MSFGQRTREPLRVTLSTEELARKADEQSSIIEQYALVEAEKASATKTYAERLKQLRQDMERLAHDIRSKSEERSTEIYEVPRWPDQMVDVIRVDTGEVVRSRVLQPGERQQRLRAAGMTDDGDEGGSN